MKQCEVCGKGSLVRGHRIKLRGKFNPQPKTRRYPNIQPFRMPSGKRVYICAQCIKTFAKKAKIEV